MNEVFANTKLPAQQFVLGEQELADKKAVDPRDHVLVVMVRNHVAQPIAR